MITRFLGVKIFTISVNSIGFVPEMLGIVGDADNVFGPMDEDRLEERLLAEVEHSRSCDVQLVSANKIDVVMSLGDFQKKNEKTTSAFKSRTTEFLTTVAADADFSENSTDTPVSTVVEDSGSSSTLKPLESGNSVFTGNTSEQLKPSNRSEEMSAEPVTFTPTDVSHAWSEPIQLFTVESGHLTEAHKLTNLTNLLEEEEQVPKNQTAGNKLETTEDITISTITTVAPAVTTICITQPVATSTVAPVTSQSSTESFLTKLGVKKEKDPISKFLGRDVPNITLEKGNDSDNKDKDSEVLSKKTESFKNSSSNDSEKSETPLVPTPKPTTKFAFATRVTFRPAFTASSRSSTTQSTTESTPATETSTPTSTTVKTSPTTTTSSTTTSATSQPITTTPTSTSTSTSPPKTPTSTQPSTLSGVTAFPTLLSMEKAVRWISVTVSQTLLCF